MSGEGFGPRPGETAIDLPAAPDAGIHFIGRIRTPWVSRDQCPKNAREARERGDAALCRIEVDPLFAPGLAGLESSSHIWVLYWMDRAPRNLIVQTPKHYGDAHGVFSLRSPARPNPIAMAAVELRGIAGATLTVLGLDCLDGTPLVDLKPYFASTDSWPDASVGWHAERHSSRA